MCEVLGLYKQVILQKALGWYKQILDLPTQIEFDMVEHHLSDQDESRDFAN